MAAMDPDDIMREMTPPLDSDDDENPTFVGRLLGRSRSQKRPAPSTAPPVPQPAPLSPAEIQHRMRQQAQRIDQILSENDMRGNYEEIRGMRGDFEHLNLRPDITPKDQDWQARFAIYQSLVLGDSIKSVLEGNFKEWQRLLLLPPMTKGSILELQKKNALKYKELLKTQLKGVHDNAITKLTMVHFGLPVEAFTLNNILRAGEDDDDPEDTEEEAARIQRIMYAEKPLEFLDLYHERSHGFPMLRRPKVHMRGGSGSSSNDNPPPVKQFYLYGPNGGRKEMMDDKARTFRDDALEILGIDRSNTTDWNFVVDQYHTGEPEQRIAAKSFIRSFDVSSKNYEKVWEESLKFRVRNPHRSWIMVVNLPRANGEKAPKTYECTIQKVDTTTAKTLAPKAAVPRNSAPTHAAVKIAPSTTHSRSKTTTASTGDGLIICISDLDTSNSKLIFEEVKFSDNALDFAAKVRQSLSLNESEGFVVSFYSNQLDRTVKTSVPAKLYSHNIIFPGGNGDKDYNHYISPLLNSDEKNEWTAVATLTKPDKIKLAPQTLWPPEAVLEVPKPQQQVVLKERPTKAIIWRKLPGTGSLGFAIEDSADSFLDEALKQLQLEKNTYTGLSVDFYSNQLDRTQDSQGPAKLFHHTVDLPKDQLKDYYTKYLAADIFHPSQDWYAVIRETYPNFVPDDTFTPGTVVTSGTSETKSYLYGYAGKLLTQNPYQSFIETALDLLDISPRADWSFTADIFERGTRDRIQVHEITKSHYITQYILEILPHINNGRAVFVRHRSREEPQTWEPDEKSLSIVRLNLKDRGTAYWKVSSDKKNQAGINQVQDSFIRAMQVLYPARQPRSREEILVAGVDIGFGAMELSDDLWEKVQKDLRKAKRSLDYDITYDTSFDASRSLGVRLAGSEHCSVVSKHPKLDWDRIAEEIRSMSSQYLHSDAELLKSGAFRLWKSAADREANSLFALISYEPKSESATLVKNLLGPKPLAAECLWFRPEYPSFTIGDIDVPKKRPVTWDASSDQSLASFRNALKSLFNDNTAKSTKFFQLTIAKSNQRFVIDSDTTEDQWRTHVFDCFHSNSLLAKRNGSITADIDATTPWGLKEPTPFPRPFSPTTTPNPSSSITAPTGPGKHTSRPLSPITIPPRSPTILGSGSYHSTSSNPKSPPKPPVPPQTPPAQPRPMNPPRFNKDRILKPQVSRPKPQKYDPWIIEQNRQDRLKRDSWWKDQSVIEPGQKPEPPIFGPSRELLLSAGPNLPQIYAQRLTPTDYMQLRDENQMLRNMVLDRMTQCTLCDQTFANYKPEDIRAHHKEHAEQLQWGGLFCPICGTKDWTFMDLNQRRAHLYADQDERERQKIKDFWADMYCPICNENLAHKDAPAVLRHIASHTPDVLKYCDRCSRNLSVQSPAEVSHHDRICTNAPRKGAPVMSVFCNHCGWDRTKETERQRRQHDAQCGMENGDFCEICGMDLTILPRENAYSHHKECRNPAGLPRSFCTRCGKDLLSMNDLESASHKQECYLRDPRPQYNQEKQNSIEYLLKKEQVTAARNLKDRIELDEREKRLKTREAELTKDLGVCPYGANCKDKTIGSMQRGDLFKHLQQHVNDAAPVEDIGTCPFDTKEKLGVMNIKDLIKHFKTHVNANKVGKFKCLLKKADGTTCGEDVNVPDLSAHLASTLPSSAASGPGSDFTCPIHDDTGEPCGHTVPIDVDGMELIAHLEAEHPERLTQPGAGVASFMCPLTENPCGGLKIGVPTDPVTADTFRRHYLHQPDLGAATPPPTPAPLPGRRTSKAAEKAKNAMQKAFKENQKKFRDIINGIAPGGTPADAAAMMAALNELVNQGGGDDEGSAGGTSGAGDKTDDRNIQTGFDPSPTSPNFPGRKAGPNKKRKVGSDAHDARRRPDETTAGYIKRQKLTGSSTTVSRVPAATEFDDEEDEAYRGPRSVKRDAVALSSVKKAKKRARFAGDEHEAEQGSLHGVASTPTTRRSTRTLSGTSGPAVEAEVASSSMRRIGRPRKDDEGRGYAPVVESPAKRAKQIPAKK